MLLLVPYHGLLFLQNRGDEMLGLDASVFWLHLWRMGLFFAVSGFLAAMTLALWGPSRQVRQRLKRIAIPLALAMVTLLPLQKAIVIWFYHRNNPGPVPPQFEYTLGNLLTASPHHLWFLSYVLAFNLAAVIAWLLVRRGPRIAGLFDRGARALISSPALVPALAAISAVPLWVGGFHEAPGIVAKRLIPFPVPFAYYGVFFVFGWMLWRHRDLLPRVEDHPWRRIAVAAPASVLAFLLYSGRIPPPEGQAGDFLVLVAGGVAAWSTMFAVWGLFARFLSGARPWVRYLADASYWIYLIHIPFLVAIQLSLARSGLPPMPRVLIATGGALALALLTYRLFVRHTPIGTLLHGPRERAGRPGATGAPAVDPTPTPLPDSRLA